jgi:glycosyltransferase involved in cell wall biosynthesis
VKQNCIVTIPNGVNPVRFCSNDMQRCRRKYNLSKSSLIVGYLGSLYNWAGIEYLIEAGKNIISSFPNVLFVIGGGEEPYLSLLIKKVQSQRLDDYFKFFGSIKWDDASDFINTFDIAVAPVFFNNLDSGISSQKVFAYLSCGKPVIGSDIPGLGDMLEKEGVGISFPMGDSIALSRAIIRLFRDDDIISSMGKKARKLVLNSYSWEIIVNRLENHFLKLITNCNR